MTWIASFVRAIGSACYWWGVGWLLYLVTGGDSLPLGRERGFWQEYGPVTLIVVAAVVINALLLRLDRGRN